MRPIKIVVRTKGLFICTKDLSIGLNILNHIANHGIMNYNMIHNSLLDKINKVLGHTIGILGQIAGQKETKGHVSTVEEDTKYPKFTKKSKIPRQEILATAIDTSDKSRIWSKDELKVLKENINLSDKELVKLIPTRSLAAVAFKRRLVLRKAGKPTKRGKSKSSIWTQAELEVLKSNMHMRPKQLQTLPWLKRKTRQQISQKKYELTTRVKLTKQSRGDSSQESSELEEGRKEHEPANEIKLEERRREQDEN